MRRCKLEAVRELLPKVDTRVKKAATSIATPWQHLLYLFCCKVLPRVLLHLSQIHGLLGVPAKMCVVTFFVILFQVSWRGLFLGIHATTQEKSVERRRT